MVQHFPIKGYGPVGSSAFKSLRGPAAPHLVCSGAPAFPRMKRVQGRKRLMRLVSDSDSDSEESGFDTLHSASAKLPRSLPESLLGGDSGSASGVSGSQADDDDVEYLRTERVVLTQTLLTSWWRKRG